MAAERQSPPPRGDLSRVAVTINGRKFRMACEDGQEAHLRRLASDFDQRIGRLRSEFGEIGNTRLTVMAALTISDELVLQRAQPAAHLHKLVGDRERRHHGQPGIANLTKFAA